MIKNIHLQNLIDVICLGVIIMKKTKLISYVLALTMANSLVLPAYKASAVELNPNGSVLEIPSNEDINKNIIELP